jgi:hypothetical protein
VRQFEEEQRPEMRCVALDVAIDARVIGERPDLAEAEGDRGDGIRQLAGACDLRRLS